jgi:hypothetical protein
MTAPITGPMNVQPLPVEKYETVHPVVLNLRQPAFERLLAYGTEHGQAVEEVMATALGLLYGLTDDGSPVNFDDLPRDAIYKPAEPFGGSFADGQAWNMEQAAERAAEAVRRSAEKLERERTDVRDRQPALDLDDERSEPVVLEGQATRAGYHPEHADFGLIPPGLATRLEKLESQVHDLGPAAVEATRDRQAEHLADLERRMKLIEQDWTTMVERLAGSEKRAAKAEAIARKVETQHGERYAVLRDVLSGATDTLHDALHDVAGTIEERLA